MLAGARSFFLLSVLFAISLLVVMPAPAQSNGIPPSVTSMGFGGRFLNGIPPSVTSMGPNGYGNSWSVFGNSVPGNCCANFFWPVNPNAGLSGGHHHHHKKDDGAAVGVVEPVYIPHADVDAAPYAGAPGDDDDSVDDDPGVASGPLNPDLPIAHARDRNAADKSLAAARPDSGELASPVAAQPATVLIFKDGHHSEASNYAIAGDTLFDFSAGRTHKIPLSALDLPATHKANDDRGVDFQIPAGTAQ
jgi:hypothetical protein